MIWRWTERDCNKGRWVTDTKCKAGSVPQTGVSGVVSSGNAENKEDTWNNFLRSNISICSMTGKKTKHRKRCGRAYWAELLCLGRGKGLWNSDNLYNVLHAYSLSTCFYILVSPSLTFSREVPAPLMRCALSSSSTIPELTSPVAWDTLTLSMWPMSWEKKPQSESFWNLKPTSVGRDIERTRGRSKRSVIHSPQAGELGALRGWPNHPPAILTLAPSSVCSKSSDHRSFVREFLYQ